MKRILSAVLAIVLPIAAIAGEPLTTEAPGDGGDHDFTTFSFHPDSRVAPLLGPAGEALRPESVPQDYGRLYAVTADGVDVCSVEYAWKLGYGGDHPRIQPRSQDLSRWESARVENGWLAIDPATGRFKFARGNSLASADRLEHKKQIVLGNLTPWRLEARGQFAFTVGEEETHALQAFDASDPKEFRYGGYSSMGGYPFTLAVGRTHAYVSGSGSLSIHDVRDPRKIRYVKTIWYGGSEKPWDLLLDEANRRLWQQSIYGLEEFDVTDPDDPVLIQIHEGIALPFLQSSGDCLFSLRAGEGPQALFTFLTVFRRDPTGKVILSSEFPVAGKIENTRSGIRHLMVKDGLAVLLLSTGLHLLDVKDPDRPRRLAQIQDLAPVPEYYEKGGGGHDVALRDGLLYVACGRSQGGVVNPRETGLFLDHAEFEERVLAPRREHDIRGRIRGGLRIYDLASPERPMLVGDLDDEAIGCDAITNVALGDGVLFLLSRMLGVLAYDLTDPRRPTFRGKLSAAGEVDWARLAGDKLYAVGNGLYTIEPYPAESAKLLGFCFTNTFLFGRSLTMNPFPAENPGRQLFMVGGTWHRRIDVRDPERPRLTDHAPPPVGYGRWKGNVLYAPSEKSLDVYRVDATGRPERVYRFPVAGPATHLEIYQDHLFLFSLNRETPGEVKYLEVFNLKDPERPAWIADLKGPTDGGAMFCPEVFFYRGFCFLPGWQSSRHAGGGGGWGNFLGVRVLDLREPKHPKVHCLIPYVPEKFSFDTLDSAQSFHAVGDTLYVADYWTGVHVFDISRLASERTATHLAVAKDRELPWSVSSYTTSASGYGRYLYTTHFGHVNIWEIPVEDDVPKGNLQVRKQEGVAAR